MASDLAERIGTLARWIRDSLHLVVFTGAGISTESGLPDFRGPDGVWTRRDRGLSTRWPDLSLAEPNASHLAIAELQRQGRLGFLISQNIDNLHRRSGIRPELIAELHGNAARVRCTRCESEFDRADAPGACTCGGTLRSSVVDFGQSLPVKAFDDACRHSQQCDLFVVVGSSLVVTPAADMPVLALEAGARLVIVNQGDTPLDEACHLRFEESIGTTLPAAVGLLRAIAER